MLGLAHIVGVSLVVSAVSAQWGALDLPQCASSCENAAVTICSDFSLECLCKDAAYLESLICCVDQQCGFENSQGVLSTLANSICLGRGFFDLPTVTVSCRFASSTTRVGHHASTSTSTSSFVASSQSQSFVTSQSSYTSAPLSSPTSSTQSSLSAASTSSAMSSATTAMASSTTTSSTTMLSFATSQSSGQSPASTSAIGQSQSASSSNGHHSGSSVSAGEIAGAVVGSLAAFALLGALAYFLARRLRRPREPRYSYSPGYSYPGEGKIGMYDGT